jgi:hypothetical protein
MKKGAYRIYNKALRDGLLVRLAVCDQCGLRGRIEGHHHDYSKPLDVSWLCKTCHIAVHRPKRHSGIQAAIEACGSVQALATRLGKLRQAVQRWERVPAEMVVTVEQATGVPRERLRPDLYRVQDNVDVAPRS